MSRCRRSPLSCMPRLGLFAFAVAALSIASLCSGLLEIVQPRATFAAALVFAGLGHFALLRGFHCDLAARAPTGRALLGLFLGLALLAYPAYLGTRAWMLLQFADITTDTAKSSVLMSWRVPVGHAGVMIIPARRWQRSSAPPIDLARALSSMSPPKVAYDAALALVTKRKWFIGDARTPTLARRDGEIEAVARRSWDSVTMS